MTQNTLNDVLHGHKRSQTSQISYNGSVFNVIEHIAATFNQYYEPTKIFVIIQNIG